MKTPFPVTTLLALLPLIAGVGVAPADAAKPAPYGLDVAQGENREVSSWLKGGGRSPAGDTLAVNTLYWTRNGKPWTPVMGEFHYLRYPNAFWEEQLLKMKAGGVSIAATYVLWVNHEHPQGVWHWDGDNDLRRFVQLCQKHGLYVWLRIGPYCNAESRNGGLPGWAAKTGNRSDAPWYLDLAKQLYAQVAEQTKGLYFKDGGPIIGVQLENEYAIDNLTHIPSLQAIAEEVGIVPPFYSVTANSRYPYERGDVIPLQGAYPYRGWASPGPTSCYLYQDDAWIAMLDIGGLPYDGNKFPRAACEVGAGCWSGPNNRFIVPAYDSEGLIQNLIGRGNNIIGYYMFQGGTQKAGMEMDGHPLTYDFQAPLGEYGQAHPSYASLKLLHHFMNDFGDILAPMQPVRPPGAQMLKDPRDVDHLRFTSRFKDDRGFVFMTTCQPYVAVKPIPDVQLEIKLKNETLLFPSKPFTLKENLSPIFPINFDLNGTILRYATAQLLCKLEDQGVPCYVFFAVDGLTPEFQFSQGAMVKTEAEAEPTASNRISYFPTPSYAMAFTLTSSDGRKARVLLLTRKDAEQSWRMDVNGAPRLFLSDANVLMDTPGLAMTSFNPTINLAVFPPLHEPLNGMRPKLQGVFSAYKFSVPPANLPIEQTQLPARQWSVELPPNLPANVNDVFIGVKYVVDAATLLLDRVKYSDDRANGSTWQIGLKRFLDGKPHILAIDTSAFKDVYGIPAEVHPRTPEEEKGMIRSVTFLPQYAIRLPVQAQ